MGILSYSNKKFYFATHGYEPEYTQEKELAKNAQLVKPIGALCWETRSPLKAVKLRRYADESAERKFKKTFITDLAPPEYIVYPDHQAPYSWQIESAWWALTRSPSYVADPAGLGKTAVAIMAINSSPGKTLIVCPPYLKYNWVDEINLWWAPQPWTVRLIENDSSDFTADILILPDSLLTNKKIQAKLKQHKFKWLIVDEAHRYKTSDSQRTDTLLGDENDTIASITDLAERTVLLSGTPIPNGRPIEMYPVLSRLAPESILHRNAEQYWKTFCGGKSITRYEGKRPIVQRDLKGASNLEQWNDELCVKFMIRHDKAKCLKDLPPKIRQIIFLDATNEVLNFEQKYLKNYNISDFMKGHDLGTIATYRKMVGKAKIKGSLQYIKDQLDATDEKYVVAGFHIDVVEGLYKGLKAYQPVKIRGGMTGKEKHEATHQFKTNPHCRLVTGNTHSMGLGLTLTEARTLINVEPEWPPGTNEQIEDRVHRITQTRQVFIKYLVLRGSLDERMLHQSLGKESNMQKLKGRS